MLNARWFELNLGLLGAAQANSARSVFRLTRRVAVRIFGRGAFRGFSPEVSSAGPDSVHEDNIPCHLSIHCKPLRSAP